MDTVVPANRIFQPFLLREAECGFNLRADISLTDSAIEIGHENYGRNLLYQGAISGFEVRELSSIGTPRVSTYFLRRSRIWLFRGVYDVPCSGNVLVSAEDTSQRLQDFLSLRRIQFRFGHGRRRIVGHAVRVIRPRKRNHCSNLTTAVSAGVTSLVCASWALCSTKPG